MTKTSGFFGGRPSACLKLAVVCLLPVLLATCADDGPGGPSGPPVIGRVEFTAGPLTSNGYFGPNLPIDRVHVIIVRPPADTLRDTTRAFDPNLNRLRFELPVLLTAAAESLDVTLELLSGPTVLFSGTSRLEARAGPPGATPPPAIPLNYTGPGSQIAQLSIAPLDSILGQGDSLIMRVTGVDAGQLPIPAFYVGWSSSDTTVARVNGAGVVRGRVPRGTVFIRARTPNTQLFPSGIVESTTVTLVPDPSSLAKVGGDNQSAPAGSRLPQLLEVAVLATDGLPVPGVTVTFASAITGAIIDSASATSDASGIARTGVVLGPAVGPQSFTASAPGTATVTFTANAAVTPTPTWTGAVSFDWNNAGNWSTGAVPGGADSVTIPAGTPNSPDLTSNVSIAALRNDNVLNMANFSLTLDGNLRGSGSISGNSTSSLLVAAPATIIDHAAVTNLVVSGTSIALARNMTVSGNLTVQGNPANLDLNGHTVTVNGDFATQANGTLTMTNVLDTLRVLDDVLFNGGSTAGKLSSGAIIVVGDFTQQATSSGQSYAPTGNHIDIFAGAGVQTITFATPGATSSNFETLGLANSAGGVTLASDVFLAGPVGFATGVPRVAHGTGQTLFVAELRASNATLDNILVAANNVLLTQFDSINFINYSPTATPLTISHPGSATPFVMNDLSFGVTPTSGFYISATDLVADANVLTLNLVNPTPGASGGLVRTQGGAVVNWPFVPAGSRIWTGAVDSDWFKPGNWNPAIVPSSADNVVIPSTGTAPVLTGGAGVHHLTIQPGATLTSSFDFDVSGDAIVNGNFAGSGIIVMSTHGSSVAGNISNLEIDLATRFESILVSGTLTVSGLIEVQRGHLDLGGHTVTTGNFATISEGMLKMVNPGDALIVNGNADFGGEDPTGVLTAGTIRLRGNFAQLTGITQGSFVATGTNRVILDGTGPQFVTFTSPAINGSRFQDFEIVNSSDTVFMGSDIFVGGQLISQIVGGTVVSGAAQLITTNGIAISTIEFNNARVALLTGTVTQFDNVTWTGFAGFVTQFTVTRPTGSLTFANHTFASTPTTGFYLRADDTNSSDGQVLTINMVNPTPATPGAFVQTVNGAVVNWPGAAGGTAVWTGAVNSDWFNTGNWSTGAVPTAVDDVDFTQFFSTAPSINANTAIRNLAVSSGRFITVNSGVTLTINGDAVLNGTISGPGTVDMAGSGGLVSGVFPNVRISGPYTLGGTLEVHGTFLTIQSDLTVGANTITLFANLQVIGSGRLIMTNPNALVVVQGFAVFDGASTVGTLTAGLLAVTNNFTQSATTSSNSFTASGSHLTLLNGAGLQVVTFANPTVSGFQSFQYGGSGSLTLGSDIRVLGAYSSVVSRTISGSGRKLTTGGITTTNGTFDHVLIEVNSTLGGALLSITNTTFQNYPSTATQLSIVHPGSLGPATFDGLTFSSTPTSGFYISATDQNPSDGLPLTLNVTNTTPSSGSPFVQTAGGAIVNWPSGPMPVVTWTGAADTDWQNAGNWSTGQVPTGSDSVVIPAGGNQPFLTAPSFAGVLHLANGTLTLNGQALVVGTNFYSTGSGRLVMTNPNDGMSIGGDATFNGADELGSMSAGAIILLGDLIQLATNSPDSYHPSGTHVTYFSGTGTQVISFATPGITPGSSHLQEVVWSGQADLALASNVFAHGVFFSIGSTPQSITGSGQTFAVGGFSNTINNITFDNVRLVIDQATPSVLDVNNVTFVNQSPTVAQLQVGHPGDASTYTFNNLTFTTVPTTGFYLSAIDLATGNGFPFTIDMVNPTPANPGSFVQALSSVVNWPAAGGGGTSTWTGAADADWNNPANWQGGNIPNATSDVSIPAGAPNYPSLATSEMVNDMTVAPGGSVIFGGGSLDISGDLTGGGSMTNGGPTMSGTNALLVMNDVGHLVVNGTVNLGAGLAITGDLTVTGPGANFNIGGSNLDVFGNLATLNQGTIQMTTSGANVVVSGAATFEGGPMNGLLTAGQIEFRGNFTQGNSSSQQSFRSGGTLVIFNGTAQQTITMSDSLLSFFRDLDLDNVGGGILLNSMVRVTGDLAIAANVQVTASDLSFTGTGLDVNGDLFTNAGSLLQLGRLYIQGSTSIAGSYNTTSIIYTGTGQVASSTLPYQFLYSRGSVTFAAGTPTIGTLTVEAGTLNLAGRTTVTGSVFIQSGMLNPNGRTLAIGGALNVQSTGTLTMQNALDSVITGPTGAALFGGGSTVGLLTNGVLKVGGSFTQTSGTSTTSFAASGNHKTVLGAGAVRVANFASPGTGGTGSHFANLDVTAATGGLTLANHIVVDGSLISAPTGLTPQISGGAGGNSVTAMSLAITTGLTTSLIFNNAPLIVNEQGTIRAQQFDKAQFTGFPTTATSAVLMDLALVGAAGPRGVTFNSPTVQTSLGTGGLYARLISSNAPTPVTVTISGSNDPTGGPSRSNPSFGTTVNGARIVWQ